MREDIAKIVHKVFNHGLSIKERLKARPVPYDINDAYAQLDTEQQVLKGVLLSDLESRRLPDFGGDDPELIAHGRQLWRGIRFALVCWLDEIVTQLPGWGERWKEMTLEYQLYQSQLRAELFWQQAKLAEARPGSDALEVFYLCVMLGFRGQFPGGPDKLSQWAKNAQSRLRESQEAALPLPPAIEPPTDVPPRHAQEKFQRMILLGGILALCLVPLVVFLVVIKLPK